MQNRRKRTSNRQSASIQEPPPTLFRERPSDDETEPLSKQWLQFYNSKKSLSTGAKDRLHRALRVLENDGIDLNSTCRCLITAQALPNVSPKTTAFSLLSKADRRRLRVAPGNLRSMAKVLKNDQCMTLLMGGMRDIPGLRDLGKRLSSVDQGMIPMRDGRRRVLLPLKLPEVLEDIADAIESGIKHSPQPLTRASHLAYIAGEVEAQSRSKREHYQEILDILDPEARGPLTYDALKVLVARERTRWKKRTPSKASS